MLVGGGDYNNVLAEVTEYTEDGMFRELPNLITARRAPACAAVGEVPYFRAEDS